MKKMMLVCLFAMFIFSVFSACNKEATSENITTYNMVDSSITNNISAIDISTIPIDELIKIEIANDEQIKDTINFTHYYDEKTDFQTWKIIVESVENLKNFKFIELDSSEVLRVVDTIFKLDNLEANKPVLIHTYINDAALNRGISIEDDKGNVRFFSIGCSMCDGSLVLSEIYTDENTANNDVSQLETSTLDLLYKTKVTEILPVKDNIPLYFGLKLKKDITFEDFLSQQYFYDINWDISDMHIIFVARPLYQSNTNTIDSVYVSFNLDLQSQSCVLYSFRTNYKNGEFYTYRLRENYNDMDSAHAKIIDDYPTFASCWLTFLFECAPSLF